MATCKEVAQALGRDAWRDEPLWRRLTLRLHVWMCPHCRRYATQIRAIGAATRSLFREHPEDPEVLERLQQTILHHPDSQSDSADVGQ